MISLEPRDPYTPGVPQNDGVMMNKSGGHPEDKSCDKVCMCQVEIVVQNFVIDLQASQGPKCKVVLC